MPEVDLAAAASFRIDGSSAGPDVAVAEALEKSSSSVNSVPKPAESVRILDMSDPANPKTLQTFKEVTSIPAG